jgi:prefoldin alpha subunit
MSKENLESKYYEYQMIEEQLKHTHRQLSTYAQHLSELKSLQGNIDELKNIKEGCEILAPIGPGLFTVAEIKNNKKIIVNLGAGIAVAKDAEGSKEIINKQIEGLNNAMAQLQIEATNATIYLQQLQKELQELTREA